MSPELPAAGRRHPPGKAVRAVRRTELAIGTERQLYGRTAGRCEFEGCNQFLLEHHVTHRVGNFAEKAHIVAFSPGGPRGTAVFGRAYINDVSNLMLLCARCHKLVDEDPALYTVALLRTFKANHEQRIFRFTEFKPEKLTRVLTLMATVREERTVIPEASIRTALGDMSFDPHESHAIDLCNLSDSGDPAYWTIAANKISQDVRSFVSKAPLSATFQPVSVFGIARVPLLVHFGSVISSKIPVRIFNRQVLADDWTWKSSAPYEFGLSWRRKTDEPGAVLLVSLSGSIQVTSLPLALQQSGSIVEISIEGGEPTRTCLEAEESVESFRRAFLGAMQQLASRSPSEIALVPAVPVVAAIHMGRDLLPRTHPQVCVYDWDGVGTYTLALRVNDND